LVHNEISIHVTSSNVCLVCSVQLAEVFSINKWVALTRSAWCAVFVVDYLASSIRHFCVSRGSV